MSTLPAQPSARRRVAAAGGRPARHRGARGFTMVELLIVLMLVAMVSGLAGLALRDGSDARLDREAARLAALLESARAESRASGVAVRFELSSATNASGDAFRFTGLPVGALPPGRWLEPAVQAQIVGARAVLLGPEPLIGPQRVVLWLDGRQRTLATDGLSAFAVQAASAPQGTPP